MTPAPIQFNEDQTLFIDRAHEWFQRNRENCVCGRCGVVAPMAALSGSRQTCVAQWSPVAWLPLKDQPGLHDREAAP